MVPGVGFFTVKLVCNPDDPSTWPPGFTDPDQCIVRSEYTGPARIPNSNLAAMILNYTPFLGSDPPLIIWNNPGILGGWPRSHEHRCCALLNPFETDPRSRAGADPDETTFFTQNVDQGRGS